VAPAVVSPDPRRPHSEESAPLLQEALEHGFHRRDGEQENRLSVPQMEFDRLMETAARAWPFHPLRATAAPVCRCSTRWQKLNEAGDRVDTILGCFSGTLGFS